MAIYYEIDAVTLAPDEQQPEHTRPSGLRRYATPAFFAGLSLGSAIAGWLVYRAYARRSAARTVIRREGATDQRRHTLGWRGLWNRPMKIDEESIDPLTASRMTDHNVTGGD